MASVQAPPASAVVVPTTASPLTTRIVVRAGPVPEMKSVRSFVRPPLGTTPARGAWSETTCTRAGTPGAVRSIVTV